jgi:hypothetical protein
MVKGRAAIVLAVLAVSAWLFYRDSALDTFRAPLFWPFLFSAGMLTVLSGTEIADDPRGWRALVVRLAAGAGIVAGGSAWLASGNPINGIGPSDIGILAMLAAAIVVAAGGATAWARRAGEPSWGKPAACLTAVLLTFWMMPRAVALLHQLLPWR